MYIIGIDPGKSGGIATVSMDGGEHTARKVSDMTEQDVANYLGDLVYGCKKCYLEKVHSMPKQGVVSSFTFGQNFGTYLGILSAHGIPFELVTPQKWQGSLSCRTGGDKNVTKRKAQQLFPSIKVTHALADALLIAEYGRRINN